MDNSLECLSTGSAFPQASKADSEKPLFGHYYRSCPRSRVQAHEKRLMEKSLLTKLEPKEKEHQRKKIMRLFFSQINKREVLDAQEIRFWKWVRKLNPDNVNSEDRYKSMSYEFLDRLLGKEMFKKKFLPWLDLYESSLGTSSEDTKSRVFVKFIRQSVAIKHEIEEEEARFLSTLPLKDLVLTSTLDLAFTQAQPVNPGLYFEAKCSNASCGLFRAKMFVFVGTNARIDYFQAASLVRCSECNGAIQAIINIGTFECISSFTGRSKEQGSISGERRIALGYATFDEINIYQWEELVFEVSQITEHQREVVNRIIIQAFDDPVVPKKRYKKREESLEELDSASTQSEEFPIVPVPIRLPLRPEPHPDYARLLAHMDQEIHAEAGKNLALRNDIQSLRAMLDSLTNELRLLIS